MISNLTMVQRKIWCVIIVSVILLPALINFLASFTLPIEKDVVAGEEGDWVAFFGSYVGALIGAVVTLFVVYREMKCNALNIMIQNQKTHIDELSRIFVKNISSVNFVYLGSEISLIPLDELRMVSDYVLIKLNEKHMNATQIYNTWVILFQERMSEYEKLYKDCLEQYMSDINEVTKNVRELKSRDITAEEFSTWATKFNYKMSQHKEEYLQSLADESNKVLKYEKEKLQRMEAQQSKLIPNLKF